MTGQERIATALRHQEPDRVPTMEFAIDHDIFEQYLGRKVFWRGKMQEMLAYWEGRRDEIVASYKVDLADFIEMTGIDGIAVGMVPPKGFRPTPLIQLDEQTWRDHAGNIYSYSPLTHDIGISRIAALDPLPEPEPLWDIPPEVQPEEWELVDYIVERFKGKVYIFNRPGRRLYMGYPSGVGLEDQYIRLAEEPDKVAEEALAAARANKELIDLSFEHGCDNVALGGDFAFNDGPFMSPRTFERVYAPAIAEEAAIVHAHGAPFLYHSCGDCRPLLGIMVDAGVDCFQSIQPHLDIAGLKRTWGDRLALWGGFSTDTLVRGTPEQIREEVRHTIKHVAPGGGLVLGSSHSVCVGSKKANYDAMLDELDRSGWYPISL